MHKENIWVAFKGQNLISRAKNFFLIHKKYSNFFLQFGTLFCISFCVYFHEIHFGFSNFLKILYDWRIWLHNEYRVHIRIWQISFRLFLFLFFCPFSSFHHPIFLQQPASLFLPNKPRIAWTPKNVLYFGRSIILGLTIRANKTKKYEVRHFH